jgi:hypothetical protein
MKKNIIRTLRATVPQLHEVKKWDENVTTEL